MGIHMVQNPQMNLKFPHANLNADLLPITKITFYAKKLINII
jgi:hypothetical protein